MYKQAITITTCIMLVAMLMSCGSRTLMPPVGNPVVPSDKSWSMPGGDPANTRLSPEVGPGTPHLDWVTLSEYGTSSAAVVTPDGTVVVGAGLAVIAFNPDGTVRWRRPSMSTVRKLFTNEAGMVAFNFDQYTVHLISSTGELLHEISDLEYRSSLIGIDTDGTLFTRIDKQGQESDLIYAISTTGDVLWQVEAGIVNTTMKMFAGGMLAYLEVDAGLVVLDRLGQEQWRATPEDWHLRYFWQAGNGNIYLDGIDSSGQGLTGFHVYSPGGELLDSFVEDAASEAMSGFRMYGVTSEGNAIWFRKWDGEVKAFNTSGEVVLEYQADMRIEQVSFGPDGETYVLFLADDTELNQYNLVGFDAAGELIISLLYESVSHYASIVDLQGRVCFGNHEGFFAFNHDAQMEWGYDLGGSVDSIAVAQNGTVYSTAGNVIYANSPDGAELWRYSAAATVGVVMVGSDGNVYTHTTNSVIELTPDGVLSRFVSLEEEGSLGISLSADGHLYVAGSTGLVRAFMPGLIPSWEYQAPGAVTTRMAVGDNGSVYFGCNDNKLYALDIAGQPLWSFDMLSNWIRTPVVVGDSIYATSAQGGLFKIAADGTQIWRYEPEDNCYVSPAIGPDGTVYFGTDSFVAVQSAPPATPLVGQSTRPPTQTSQFGIEATDDPVVLDLNGSGKGLYAVNPDGTLKWNLHSSHAVVDEVAIDAAGNIYLGINGQLFSLNPDGTERWRHRNFYKFNAAPVLGNDGAVLFGTANMLSSIGGGN